MTMIGYDWKKLSLVQLGGLLSSPILLVGYTLGSHYCFLSCVMIILSGNLFLFLLAYHYARIFNQPRLSTIEFASQLLGIRGGNICAITLFFTMTGWAALQTHILVEAIALYCPHYLLLIIILLISIPCVLCRHNLKLIAQFNLVIIPFLMGLLLYSLFSASPSLHSMPLSILPLKTSLILIVCTALGMVFDLPTFYKDSRSLKDTRISLILLFVIFLPLVELIGCAFSCFHCHTLKQEHLPFLLQLNSSKLFLLAFILGGIASNCINLYSSSMIMYKTVRIFNFNQSISMSFVATALLYFLLANINFVSYLEVINSSIIILGTLFIFYAFTNNSSVYLLPRNAQIKNEIIFYLSLIISFPLSIFHITASGNVLLDTILLTCLILFTLPIRKEKC